MIYSSFPLRNNPETKTKLSSADKYNFLLMRTLKNLLLESSYSLNLFYIYTMFGKLKPMRFWRIYKTFLWWCKTHKPPTRRPSPTVADPNPHLYDPLTLLAIPFNSNDVINLPVQSEPHIKNVVFPTVFRFQDRSQII